MIFLSVKTELTIDPQFNSLLDTKLDAILPPLDHGERNDPTRLARIEQLSNWIKQSIHNAYVMGVQEGERK